MRRLIVACFAVFLTGCAAGEPLPSVTEKAGKNEASPPTVQMIPEYHLPLYNSFDHYNTCDYFHGFKVSEISEDGTLYYQFLRDNTDVRVLMDEDGETTVYLGDKTASFSSVFMPAGGSAGMDWVDLTDDGNPEFVYTEIHGGTGFNPNHCMVFDGVSMEELKVKDFTEDVLEAFSRITEVMACGTEYGVNEHGVLEAYSVVILPEPPSPAWYFGEAKGELVWDGTAEMFVLNGPMMAQVYEEAEEP